MSEKRSEIEEWIRKRIHQRVYNKDDCPHCDGKGKIWVTMYPTSGAELEEHVCGVCKGEGKVDIVLLKDIVRLFGELRAEQQ